MAKKLRKQNPSYRQEKRAMRKMGMNNAVYIAYLEGQCHKPRRNPYPPGLRHDEWQRGYDLDDPLGDWHGRNE